MAKPSYSLVKALFTTLFVDRITNMTRVFKSRATSITLTLAQSTGWPDFHACSANADELKLALMTALLCPLMRCSNLRPLCPSTRLDRRHKVLSSLTFGDQGSSPSILTVFS